MNRAIGNPIANKSRTFTSASIGNPKNPTRPSYQ